MCWPLRFKGKKKNTSEKSISMKGMLFIHLVVRAMDRSRLSSRDGLRRSGVRPGVIIAPEGEPVKLAG